jgi:hypothetical protein
LACKPEKRFAQRVSRRICIRSNTEVDGFTRNWTTAQHALLAKLSPLDVSATINVANRNPPAVLLMGSNSAAGQTNALPIRHGVAGLDREAHPACRRF